MKKKILSLLAAFFMLFGTSAMAQVDSTLEGDVNGDGVVDIADITAVIAIIKQNAEANPTYYWYAGWTEPTEANIATIINTEYPTDETNTSKNHNHGNEPQKLHSFRSPFSQSTSRIQPSISGLPCQPM